jgi:hypothetical protein
MGVDDTIQYLMKVIPGVLMRREKLKYTKFE